MWHYVVRRLFQVVPTMLMITLVVFVTMRSVPGDPVVTLLGDAYTQEDADAMRQAYGLDRPLLAQYTIWLGKLVRGDWGTSILSGRPVLDEANKLGKKYGGWTPLASTYSEVKGRFHSIPDYFIDFPGLYRKDLWSEIGMPSGPDSWDDVLAGGKEAMTPEVLSWDDASNNRFLASGRGSWIHNPISAYRTIEKQNKALADKIFIQLSPKGPATRLSFANCLAYAIPKFSPNQDTPTAFLEHLTDNVKDAFRASTDYNNPFLKTFAKGPLPIISEDPKLKPLEKSPEYHVTTGDPGPVTTASDEVYQQFVLIDAAAQFCSDKMDLEQTMKWCDDKLHGIYAKFA